jgi:hypothetical protein
MSKRERDEFSERPDELSNGFKVQKLAQLSDKTSEEPRRAISQEPVRSCWPFENILESPLNKVRDVASASPSQARREAKMARVK